MSLMTRAHLLEKYGLRLTMEQCAELLSLHAQTVYNQLSRGEFPIRTYKEGNRRWASYEAVADYFDGMDAAVKEAKAATQTPEVTT